MFVENDINGKVDIINSKGSSFQEFKIIDFIKNKIKRKKYEKIHASAGKLKFLKKAMCKFASNSRDDAENEKSLYIAWYSFVSVPKFFSLSPNTKDNRRQASAGNIIFILDTFPML
ncbi:hypothetical protein N5I10_06715 [Comamonas aquatica]|nr:hypothetical protein [Comamonas aquatica]MDH1673209.1 hypothetical protein [Comamonas aquatica]MDH1677728.1 hypothetical protein [Comamonas aquatica]